MIRFSPKGALDTLSSLLVVVAAARSPPFALADDLRARLAWLCLTAPSGASRAAARARLACVARSQSKPPFNWCRATSVGKMPRLPCEKRAPVAFLRFYQRSETMSRPVGLSATSALHALPRCRGKAHFFFFFKAIFLLESKVVRTENFHLLPRL